ncbi:hypothetical protein BG005_009706 [Podila minutissima]|nr:hypothetical protein BG005_009706 [Podila minutissima]
MECLLYAGLLRAQGVPTLSRPHLRHLRFPQYLRDKFLGLCPQLQSRPLKVYCTIDGTRTPFLVDINASDAGSDLQKKTTSATRLMPSNTLGALGTLSGKQTHSEDFLSMV